MHDYLLGRATKDPIARAKIVFPPLYFFTIAIATQHFSSLARSLEYRYRPVSLRLLLLLLLPPPIATNESLALVPPPPLTTLVYSNERTPDDSWLADSLLASQKAFQSVS